MRFAAGSAVSASLAPKALAAGWLATAKWIAISVVALSAVGVGVRFVMHRGDPVENVVAPVAPQVTAPVTKTIDEPAPPPVLQNATPMQHAVTPSHVPSPGASASLADQIAAVDRARAELENGDPRGARKLADAYESEYPGGAFTQEAEVVRIDALVHEGNRDAAERAGKTFFSRRIRRARTSLAFARSWVTIPE